MESIPQFLQPIIKSYPDKLLLWFSDTVYEKLLPLFGDHLLVQVAETVDLAPIEAACADHHKQNGKGRPVTHTCAGWCGRCWYATFTTRACGRRKLTSGRTSQPNGSWARPWLTKGWTTQR